MGAGDVGSAVADAGPLIHLAEIDGLSLLAIFDVLHIPDAVWQETVGSGRVPEEGLVRQGIAQRHTLLPSDVIQFTRDNGLETLHAGERESLCLCKKNGVPFVLTDDLAVREASKRLAVIPVGSLGIVARAYRTRRLSLADAERHIRALDTVSSLFVTAAIVDLAIEQLREHATQPG